MLRRDILHYTLMLNLFKHKKEQLRILTRERLELIIGTGEFFILTIIKVTMLKAKERR